MELEADRFRPDLALEPELVAIGLGEAPPRLAACDAHPRRAAELPAVRLQRRGGQAQLRLRHDEVQVAIRAKLGRGMQRRGGRALDEHRRLAGRVGDHTRGVRQLRADQRGRQGDLAVRIEQR